MNRVIDGLELFFLLLLLASLSMVMAVVLVTILPRSNQDIIDQTCLDNGGIVTKYERYRTCSIPKPVGYIRP